MEIENLYTVLEERIHKCFTAYKLSAKIAYKADKQHYRHPFLCPFLGK